MTNREVLSLTEHADRLLRWCGSSQVIPQFKRIAVMDTSDPSVQFVAGRWTLPASALRALNDFASQFDRYLRAGFSWVNLSLYGLHGAILVLGVELPPGGPTGTPVGVTSVNYSGPALSTRNEPLWDLALKLT